MFQVESRHRRQQITGMDHEGGHQTSLSVAGTGPTLCSLADLHGVGAAPHATMEDGTRGAASVWPTGRP